MMPRKQMNNGYINIRSKRWLFRIFLICWATSVLIGFLIMMFPEGPKEPLVPKSAWKIDGLFFENAKPQKGEISDSIINNSETVFFRSWSPQTGPSQGTIASSFFELPEYIVVPYAGYPFEPGIEIFLECDNNDSTLPISFGNIHETWIERVMSVPAEWCKTKGRLVVKTKSKKSYIAIGTPFKTTIISYLKESVFTIIFIHAYQLAPIFLLWGAFALLLDRYEPDKCLTTLGAAVAVCFWGYANFFMAFYLGVFQIYLNIAVTLASLIYIILKWNHFKAYLCALDVKEPMKLFFMLSIFFILAGYASDTGLGPYMANYRFAPAIWSTDNQLQPLLAEMLYLDKSIVNWSTNWQFSDRPPLLSGILLLNRPFSELILSMHENCRFVHYFHQITAISVMAFWVVPVWYFVRKVEKSVESSIISFFLVAISSFILFNTIYAWPKLLSAWLAMIAYFIIIQLQINSNKPLTTFELVIGATAAALSLMAHGGVMFGLVPVALLMLTPTFWPGWKKVFPASVAAAIVIIPWFLWQRFEDPPGNALLKSAFAGTYGFDEKHLGVLETIRNAYSDMSLSQWIQLRWDSIRELFGSFWDPILACLPSSNVGLDILRKHDQWYLFTSMKALNFGWLIIGYYVVRAIRNRTMDKNEKSIILIVAIGVTGIIANSLTTFPIHIIPHQSYFAVLAIVLGLAMAIANSGRIIVSIVATCQVLYLLIVWIVSPLMQSIGIRSDVALGWVLVSGIVVLLLLGQTRKTETQIV